MSKHDDQPQPGKGKVQVGDRAPDFTLPDQSGTPVNQLPFMLLSDAGNVIRKRYGVPTSFGLPGRVTYVIDRQGIVRRMFFSQYTSQKHVDVALQTLQSIHEEHV